LTGMISQTKNFFKFIAKEKQVLFLRRPALVY